MKFFSLNKSGLAEKLFGLLKITNKDSNLIIDRFSDGEFQPVFRESVRDEDIYILADGSTSDDIIKLCLTISAAKKAGALNTIVIYPYQPYMRQEKIKNGLRSSIS
jgi:ribose-phosphate pyrophosphokinase